MFNESDIQQLQRRNMNIEIANEQIDRLISGFNPIKLVKPALVKSGIITLDDVEIVSYAKYYDKFKGNLRIAKFVPASGAASRMFKDVFMYIEKDGKVEKPAITAIEELIKGLDKFPFYPELVACFEKKGKDLSQLIKNKAYKEILLKIVGKDGLNLGAKPKAMIPFHSYGKDVKTAFEEHISEAVKYSVQKEKEKDKKVVCHFTLLPEHIEMAEKLASLIIPKYEKEFNVTINVTFSIQSPATDTIAIDSEEELVRTPDKALLFRPGGHGALLENLNGLDADIVFIKNIDNVQFERQPDHNALYKKTLAGVLLNYQKKIINFLHKLNRQRIKSDAFLMEVTYFLKNKLCFIPPDSYNALDPDDKLDYLIRILNRPLRVCGMVKNTGETGGGPFRVANEDGSVSLQIVETAQINIADPSQKAIMESATYFNPVDIVCYLQDMHGKKFDLHKYRNNEAGIITSKTYYGNEIKVLEHPGLWNGTMWHWNSLFVVVPAETFTPVKTINDLLHPGHQEK